MTGKAAPESPEGLLPGCAAVATQNRQQPKIISRRHSPEPLVSKVLRGIPTEWPDVIPPRSAKIFNFSFFQSPLHLSPSPTSTSFPREQRRRFSSSFLISTHFTISKRCRVDSLTGRLLATHRDHDASEVTFHHRSVTLHTHSSHRASQVCCLADSRIS